MNRFGTFLTRAARWSVLAALIFQTGGAARAQSERIYAPRQRPFEVEVVVRGRTLGELFARGRRYVEAVEGEEYELRVRNPLPVRVAVALSVDGLNTIDARRASSWESSKWVVEPYQTITISGWQMSSRHARRFYFTTERDSYAAKLGRASDLGVISAVVYREDSPRPVPIVPPMRRDGTGEKRSREESGRDAESSSAQSDNSARAGRGANQSAPRPADDDYAATGIGRAVGHDVTWVQMRLERRPVAEVSIRYEYRDALIKLGVLPRPPRYDDDALRRRERARGFKSEPGYSPEPE